MEFSYYLACSQSTFVSGRDDVAVDVAVAVAGAAQRSNRSDVIIIVVVVVSYLTFDFCLRLFLSFLSLPFCLIAAGVVAFVVHFPLFPPPGKHLLGSVARQRFIDLQAPRPTTHDSDSNLDLSEDVAGRDEEGGSAS